MHQIGGIFIYRTISIHPILEEHPLVKAFQQMAEDFVAAEKAKEDQPPPRTGRGGGRGSFGGRGYGFCIALI